MKLANRLFLIFAILMSAMQMQAQEKAEAPDFAAMKQQFKADKIAFLTCKMNFTVEEAQVFWPIYNKYDAIFDQISDERRLNYDPKRCQPICQISDDVSRKMMENSFALDKRELDARKSLYEELSAHFKPNTVLRYYHYEYEFRRHVMADNRPKGGSFGKSYKND